MNGLGVALSGAAGFAVLLWINFRVARSWLYPGVVFTGIWTLVFILLCLGRDWLYPVPWIALEVYLVGAWCFTVGAYVGLGGSNFVLEGGGYTVGGPPRYASDFWLLLIIILLLLIGFPLYLHYTISLTTATPFSPDFFLQVRVALLKQAATQDRAPLIANFVVLSSIGTLLAFAVTGGGQRWRILVWTMFAFAVSYNLLTASKAGLIGLLVELVAVNGVSRGRFPIRFSMVIAILIVLAFGLITVLRADAVSSHRLEIGQAVELTLKEFVNYLVAGAVAFGVYLEHPAWVQTVWSPWRFFEHTANYFGHFFNIPSSNAQYVSIGQGLNYNVYTAYFSYYPHYGFFGVAILMLFLGIVGGYAYRKVMAGGLLWVLLYSVLFYGFIITIFSESLLTGLNFILKLLVVGAFFLYFRKIWSDAAGPVGARPRA